MKRLMNLYYESDEPTVFNLREINSSFASGSLKVMYTGKNRNGSSISKSAVKKALPSLKNVPIVCHWDPTSKEIGGHDMEIVYGDDGSMKLRNLTEPCGVVPDHAVFKFETSTDCDGNEHEYLVIDGVLLWKRQDVYEYIHKDLGGRIDHSMEVSVFDCSTDDDGFVEIKDFEFTALCLLGNCEPCFQGSELELFSAKDFKVQMEEMMAELKESYSLISPRSEVEDKFDIPTEGGEKVLEEKIALVAEYGYEVSALEFSIEELSIEELREKFDAMKAETAVEPAVEQFELNSQICEEIRYAVEAETVERPWGKIPRYSVVDYDADSKMVYCFDADDHWKLYGFGFSMNGDNVVVDFDSKKRMKFAIVDFDEGEQAMPFDKLFEDISAQFTANDTQWSEKYQTASDTIETMNTELSSLRQFKADTEAAAIEVAREEIFAQFEDLAGVEEFEDLRENCAEFELGALEEKCYAIRGRNSAVAKFTKKPDAPKLKVERTEPEERVYGGLFEKYKPTV